MTPDPGEVKRRPWHLWVVAVIGFAVYIGGARDYVLILIGDAGYIQAQFGPDGATYFVDYPLTFRVIWAVNIAAGLVAPILLVARHRWAVPVAVVGASAQVALLVLTFALRDRWAALGPAIALFDIGIALITGLFAWYAWAMRRIPRRAVR